MFLEVNIRKSIKVWKIYDKITVIIVSRIRKCRFKWSDESKRKKDNFSLIFPHFPFVQCF